MKNQNNPKSSETQKKESDSRFLNTTITHSSEKPYNGTLPDRSFTDEVLRFPDASFHHWKTVPDDLANHITKQTANKLRVKSNSNKT